MMICLLLFPPIFRAYNANPDSKTSKVILPSFACQCLSAVWRNNTHLQSPKPSLRWAGLDKGKRAVWVKDNPALKNCTLSFRNNEKLPLISPATKVRLKPSWQWQVIPKSHRTMSLMILDVFGQVSTQRFLRKGWLSENCTSQQIVDLICDSL